MVITSFDVFDTLLVREVAVPADLFRTIGSKMAKEPTFRIVASEFYRIRQEAEHQARKYKPSGEVTLVEIYSVLKERFSWSENQMLRAMESELAAEDQTLSAVPSATDLVMDARKKSGIIWFLSDMYLPSNFVEKVLRREGFFSDGDKILVSGECRASKHSGAMFEYVRQMVSPERITEWFHLGDNRMSDYEIPIRQGISATLWNRATLSFRESGLRGRDSCPPDWKSRLAGSVRKARLDQMAGIQTAKPAVLENATNIAGPLIFSFVWWCLKEAASVGIKRLYFVSRDGQILAKVARVLSKEWGLNIDIRYLYGSRKAWHLPGLVDVNAPEVNAWLWKSVGAISVAKVFERLEIDPNELKADLESNGFGCETWPSALDEQQRDRLMQLLSTPRVHDLVSKRTLQRRQALQQYLEAQDFFDGTTSALVDVGWHGNMQISLATALRQMGKAEALTGFYFGLFHNRRDVGKQTLRPFFNEVIGQVCPDDAAPMIELFLAADHGTVIGYQQDHGVVLPVFRNQTNTHAVKWGLREFQASVVACSYRLSKTFFFDSENFENICHATIINFLEFFRNPQREEAECWRDFHFFTDQEESTLLSLLPDLACRDIAMAAWLPSRRPEGWWMEGTRAIRSCPPLRLYLALREIRKAILHPK